MKYAGEMLKDMKHSKTDLELSRWTGDSKHILQRLEWNVSSTRAHAWTFCVSLRHSAVPDTQYRHLDRGQMSDHSTTHS